MKKIMQCDRKVTLEFFKPLYQNYYAAYDFGQNPDAYLEQELLSDAQLFPDYITQVNDAYCLMIAYHQMYDAVVGFLLKTRENPVDAFLRPGMNRVI